MNTKKVAGDLLRGHGSQSLLTMSVGWKYGPVPCVCNLLVTS